jgi:hypothetical protein
MENLNEVKKVEQIFKKYQKNELSQIIDTLKVKGVKITGYSKATKAQLIGFFTEYFYVQDNKLYDIKTNEKLIDLPEPEGRSAYGSEKQARREYWRSNYDPDY